MEARPIVHPSADALRAFALGKLDDSTASALTSHLGGCPDCCKEVAAISGDGFLEQLRQAYGRSITPTCTESLSDADHPPRRPISHLDIPYLPPELADNPQHEVLRELGRGGMGVVYLAKNKLMDRLEVLKVVNKRLLNSSSAVERFLREIRAAAKLSHVNLVTAYSVLQLGKMFVFAMEYIEGDDLAKVVKSRGPLPVPMACSCVQQAALGLQHAFEKKMVHRDIKPHNLMLTREGKNPVVKILDFGLAKVLREQGENTELTDEGAMLGTPDYVAPEQALDATRADIRADIYSLGCTLYFLLTGGPPFQAKNVSAILLGHQSKEPRSLNLARPKVPEGLAAAVRKMMAKDPSKRYQTPAEVAQALGSFITSAEEGETPRSSPGSSRGANAEVAKPVALSAELTVDAAKPSPVNCDIPPEDSGISTDLRKSGPIRNRRSPPTPAKGFWPAVMSPIDRPAMRNPWSK